ncbi:hydroxyacylglutathione hydrolase [Alcanivorax sp. JB21]|uniref:hydroxyacylglutathione hydrolase n=1 Tax=Alcanivorax limicola TaxID=2874102 RepID=UPI001CBC66E7|nr:hydroxyacylglutathione hydrolase [Alcanivorax limicola]MBZ2187984.1 hydroxyacylglutathione hydrolase [Alcanivorax limicola]
MLTLHPIPAFHDNYIWALSDERGNALIVDPGTADPVIDYLDTHNLTLTTLLITHHHPDHTGGIQALLARSPETPIAVYGPADEQIPGRTHALHDGDSITLPAPAMRFEVIGVPGHTLGHIAFFADQRDVDEPPLLFCGDTLFAGGCGRLFEGTPAQMLASLDRLQALPADTLVCCAHEYTVSNLRFAAAVTPDDEAVNQRLTEMVHLRDAGKVTLPSTLAEERRSNPFLRADDPDVQASVPEARGDRNAVFAALRAWKDTF